MTLKELGELLRLERERKGLSMKQVMEFTKISRRTLVALEEGDRNNLPHPVYTKGFIRNYSRLLDLNQDDFLEDVIQGLRVEDDDHQYFLTTKSGFRVSLNPSAGIRCVLPTVILLTVLTIVLTLVIVYLQRRSAITASSLIAPQKQEQDVAPVLKIPAQAAQDSSFEIITPQVSTQKEPSLNIFRTNTIIVLSKPGHMCWMEVSIDGADKREFFIRSGESVSFEYLKKLWIKLGNVGGVNLIHNGKVQITDDVDGRVKTLTFP